MTTNNPSLRQIAQGLGVSHSLLSLWRQGKRTLKPEVEARYWAFVTNMGTDLVTTQTQVYNETPKLNLIRWCRGADSNCRHMEFQSNEYSVVECF